MRFTRIKGDDRPHNVLRLPLLGKIRLGIKKVSEKSGKEYPTETDFFVCPPELKARYGDEPRVLPVMLPVEDEEMFLRQFYAVYGGNQKVKCMGNGEVCERRGEDGVTKQEHPCPHPENCDYGKQFKCRARTIIQVVLPDVNMGGVYQISTGSINSDIDIRSGIEMSKHLFGRISWVPMILRREERKIPDPETGKMQTHWPVKLFPLASVEQVNMIRSDNNRILEHQKKFALPEPVYEGPQDDTPVEIIDEYNQKGPQKTEFTILREKIEACATTGNLKTLWDEIMAKKKAGTIGHPEYTSLATYKDEQKAKIDKADKHAAAGVGLF